MILQRTLPSEATNEENPPHKHTHTPAAPTLTWARVHCASDGRLRVHLRSGLRVRRRRVRLRRRRLRVRPGRVCQDLRGLLF